MGGKEEGNEICYKIPHNDKDYGDADKVDKTCDTLKSRVLAGLHLQLAPGRLDALQIRFLLSFLIIIIINFHQHFISVFLLLLSIIIIIAPGRLDALQMHIL